MAITEGAIVAGRAPSEDWSRGGKGGGCPLLYLASCWVEAPPCPCDVIITCRDVSGYANRNIVTVHQGGGEMVHQ
jgi:hypothetical protein